ncbi:iron ABC transporter permease [Ureaplasma parvum]|uniref:Ferrichrome ABC transporter n=3 Tax=Ureaplasma parvum TaxID=134821 RepID=Q9PRC3_UREPA|nr:iron ABC transporter permease [Ureaplasma parvum]pir/H82942/ ferrichrome ABC transporter UU022 [imported] - Ureaplasma urealyticum [Ureaplasma urealyticum]AAF30427.1 ferrichrome ABC transporter [Ureaplasma parvum serovar 3 str. ATCC 700970]ACA33090.1 ferrichrome ABC transporter [Ureaplasma parvum serovar 3 str. ATCC 27815]ASD24616.1 iron ABC transporter permease [Ureaplasma parvum]ASD25113.1 iron ABC transporter permease [Ureaplasma parvum]ASD28952.1 iron ABC transporter permease [Ureaplas
MSIKIKHDQNLKHQFEQKLFFRFKKNKFFLSLSLLIITIILTLIAVAGASRFINVFSYLSDWKIITQLLFSGIALGISGYILQRLTKNRLADSSLLGMGNINLVILTILFLIFDFGQLQIQKRMEYVLPFIYLIGSTMICFFIHFLCNSSTGYIFKRIIVSGIIINLITIVIAQSLRILMSKESSMYLKTILLGNIESRSDFCFYFCFGMLTISVIWLMLNATKFKIMVTNQQISGQLGINNKSLTIQTFICISLLVSVSYSLSGNVIFVGIVAANFSFNYVKNNISNGIINAGLIGGIVLLISYIFVVLILNLSTDQTILLVPIISGPYFLYQVILLKN